MISYNNGNESGPQSALQLAIQKGCAEAVSLLLATDIVVIERHGVKSSRALLNVKGKTELIRSLLPRKAGSRPKFWIYYLSMSSHIRIE